MKSLINWRKTVEEVPEKEVQSTGKCKKTGKTIVTSYRNPKILTKDFDGTVRVEFYRCVESPECPTQKYLNMFDCQAIIYREPPPEWAHFTDIEHLGEDDESCK